MTISQQAQTNLLRQLCQMFIDAVKEGGSLGAPGGVLYAAVLDKMSLYQFEQMMSALVAMGKVRRCGELYHFVADL
jgi:hypothetical protein